MKTLVPGGRPQKVSLVPLRKRFDWTVSANQLVLPRLVENCGERTQLLAPVDGEQEVGESAGEVVEVGEVDRG